MSEKDAGTIETKNRDSKSFSGAVKNSLFYSPGKALGISVFRFYRACIFFRHSLCQETAKKMPVGSGNSAAKRKPAEYEVFTAGVIWRYFFTKGKPFHERLVWNSAVTLYKNRP